MTRIPSYFGSYVQFSPAGIPVPIEHFIGSIAESRLEARTPFGRPRWSAGSATAAAEAPFAVRFRATLAALVFFALVFFALVFFALVFFAEVTEVASRFECQT